MAKRNRSLDEPTLFEHAVDSVVRQVEHKDWFGAIGLLNDETERDQYQIGLLQFAPHSRSPEANVQLILEMLRDIDLDVPTIVVLPELFLSNYDSEAVRGGMAISQVRRYLEPIRACTQDRQLSVVGSLAISRGVAGVSNSAVSIHRGLLAANSSVKARVYAPLESELQQGTARDFVSFGSLRATIQVCMDIVDPLPSRRGVQLGARAILGPAAVSVDFLRTIHKARSLENQVVTVFCNRYGTDSQGIQFLGKSAIFLPDGTELSASSSQDAVLTVRLYLQELLGFAKRFG
ncbi:MAG: carbon-nitrogen hydrolase family protein [Candidatus Saccharimonadales bacterium]